MYTIIEEIEVNPSHMASQINSQTSRPDYSQSFRKKYYEDPSETYPSEPGSIKMWSQDPQDMYHEPIRQRARIQDPSYHEPQFQNYMSKALNRTSIKSLMNKPQDVEIMQQPEPVQEQKPVVVQNIAPVVDENVALTKELQKSVEEVKELVKVNTEYFKEKERRMRHKIKMLENLLKVLILLVILFLFILLLRK